VPKTWVKGKTVLNANSNFKDEDKLEEKDRIYQPQMKINLKKVINKKNIIYYFFKININFFNIIKILNFK